MHFHQDIKEDIISFNSALAPLGDYGGLASLIFTEIFSADFLTPMEESDTSFQMEVRQ